MKDENKEGIGGMANPGRYGIERIAYWLMRLTGLGLLGYFIAHIYETSSILQGKMGWDEFLELTQTTEGHLFLTLVKHASLGLPLIIIPHEPHVACLHEYLTAIE